MIIDLDQTGISELALHHDSDAGVAKLRDVLRRGHSQGKLCCPVPPETIMETLPLEPAGRQLVYELQCELADCCMGGPLLAFKGLHKMIHEETLAMARGDPPPSSFEVINWRPLVDEIQAEEKIRELTRGKASMEAKFKLAEPATFQLRGMTHEQARSAVILEHVRHLYRQIERLESGKLPCPEDHMAHGLACFLNDNHITPSELGRLKRAVIDHEWERIPVIRFRTLIAAQLEVDFNRKAPSKTHDVNDEIDVPRGAVALHAADVLITDRKMVAAIKAKAIQFSRTQVYTIREMGDAADFIEQKLALPGAPS